VDLLVSVWDLLKDFTAEARARTIRNSASRLEGWVGLIGLTGMCESEP